jgi:hypothetical protein
MMTVETRPDPRRHTARGVAIRLVLTGVVVLAQLWAVVVVMAAFRVGGAVAAALALTVASTLLAVVYEGEEVRALLRRTTGRRRGESPTR